MMLAQVRRRAARRAAFTLLEVLVVVAILVILAGAASVSIFRYMEDAKVGRAKNDMRVIEQAIKAYYTEKGEWPTDLTQITYKLEQGSEGLKDPWGGQYTFQVTEMPQDDGQTTQRPQVYCQPPGGKPQIFYPEK